MQIALSINTDVINKATSQEQAALNHNMRPCYMTVDELADHIKRGHPFTPAWLKPRENGLAARNNANWVSARLVAIDIDNSIDSVGGKRKRTEEEGYVSMEDVLRDENIRRQAMMIYTSPSHKPDHHRMRIVFVLPEVVQDSQAYKRIVDAICDRFHADTAATAISQMFYGSKDCELHMLGNVCERQFVEDSLERVNAVTHETRKARMYIAQGVPAVDEVRKMLAVIPDKIDYLDWMRIVSAVGNSYPEEIAFDLISAKWQDDTRDLQYKLRHRLHKIGIGTLIYHAKRYGWNPPVHMYDDPPKPKEAAKHVEKFLGSFYRWRFNVVRNQVEYCSVDDANDEWHNFDDYCMHSILRELRAEGINVSKERVVEVVSSNFSPRYDPINDYFKNDLPTWDNVDRFQTIADCIPIPDDDSDKEAANRYNYVVLGKWLISAVACGMTGKANHICPILQGPQGAYKTTFILGLCPPQLRRYLTVGTINNDKDTLDAIAGSFMYVDDELATMNRKEAEIMKRIITQEDIRFRQSYARFRSEHQRRASFIGSVNKMMFLNDETGSRRFPVIRVGGKINIRKFQQIDIHQVWAQALHELRSGEAHWFDDETIEEINERNRAHQMRNEAEELLLKYCSPATRDQEHTSGVAALVSTDLAAKIAERHFNELKGVVRIDDRFINNLGKALHSGGFIRFGKKKNGVVQYVWLVKWS